MAPRRGSIAGPPVLRVDAGMMGTHSTHGYTYFIVVGFILTTN